MYWSVFMYVYLCIIFLIGIFEFRREFIFWNVIGGCALLYDSWELKFGFL